LGCCKKFWNKVKKAVKKTITNVVGVPEDISKIIKNGGEFIIKVVDPNTWANGNPLKEIGYLLARVDTGSEFLNGLLDLAGGFVSGLFSGCEKDESIYVDRNLPDMEPYYKHAALSLVKLFNMEESLVGSKDNPYTSENEAELYPGIENGALILSMVQTVTFKITDDTSVTKPQQFGGYKIMPRKYFEKDSRLQSVLKYFTHATSSDAGDPKYTYRYELKEPYKSNLFGTVNGEPLVPTKDLGIILMRATTILQTQVPEADDEVKFVTTAIDIGTLVSNYISGGLSGLAMFATSKVIQEAEKDKIREGEDPKTIELFGEDMTIMEVYNLVSVGFAFSNQYSTKEGHSWFHTKDGRTYWHWDAIAALPNYLLPIFILSNVYETEDEEREAKLQENREAQADLEEANAKLASNSVLYTHNYEDIYETYDKMYIQNDSVYSSSYSTPGGSSDSVYNKFNFN
jgi:hypothetical protein